MKNFNIHQKSSWRYQVMCQAQRSFLGLLACLTVMGFLQVRPVGAETISLMLFGDSLMTGYGLPQNKGFAPQLEKYLAEHKSELGLSNDIDIQIINASVSGDTSGAGLARLEWSLTDKPDILLLELGANDGLRGLPPTQMAENLSKIITRLKEEKIEILLAGMMSPPNMGPDYGKAYNQVFKTLGQDPDLLFYPFFLDGVVAQPKYNQTDGMHPNADGVMIIVTRIAPMIVRLIEKYHMTESGK